MAYTTINKSTDHFNTKLYTGNGGTNAITGVGFQPDFTWIKARSITKDHLLFDAIRGVTNAIKTNSTAATDTNSDFLTAFGTDGFTVGSQGKINTNSATYVSWNWKGGGSAVTNNVGDITSSVSCNNAAGISIITWTGDGSGTNVGTGFTGTETIGFATVKKYSTTSEWQTGMYGAYSGNYRNFAYHFELNSTSDLSGAGPYMMTSQTSGDPTKLKLATEGWINGVTYVAYVFKPVRGFSKMGYYTGNGNSDGPFVYTGFRPAWILRKKVGTDSWMLVDDKRLGRNPDNAYLFTNATQSESDIERIDILSNGFKLRTTDGGDNGMATRYAYMAFASAPVVGTNNIPATAR